MSTTDQVADIVAPLVEAAGAQLYDVDFNAGILRISIDHEGGVDMALISEVSRSISRALDEADPIASSYTLEVSSPGIERRLRVPAHYRAVVGQDVQLKLRPGVGGDRRLEGTLLGATDNDITVAVDGSEQVVALADITRAQVVHDWDAPPPETSNEQDGASS